MQYIEIPEFPILRGEKALKALYDFIDELEKQEDKELTEKQTTALIKLAKGLISTIETETQPVTSGKDVRKMDSMPPFLFAVRATSNGTIYLTGFFPAFLY